MARSSFMAGPCRALALGLRVGPAVSALWIFAAPAAFGDPAQEPENQPANGAADDLPAAPESIDDEALRRGPDLIPNNGPTSGSTREGSGSDTDAGSDLPGERDRSGSASSGYRFLDDREALLSGWVGSGLAEELVLGTSVGGRELFAVQFGGAGARPLDQRTTIFLIGALDGISVAGSETVIEVTNRLLAAPGELPADATFVAIPWANPDGLQRWLDTGCGAGRNDRPQDDDGDGLENEDGFEDLDGDGQILEMLIEDADGPWVRGSDERFLRAARPGEAPRYLRTREGRDDDGDGRFNEDPPGGVALDHNFPVDWRGQWSGYHGGPWPLSEPASRVLAELLLERRTALVFVLQGNHGRLATPGGWPHERPGEGSSLALPLSADRPTYRELVERFAGATGRPQVEVPTLYEASGRARPGAAVDWLYSALGTLSMELSVWGPEVEGGLDGAIVAGHLRRDPLATPQLVEGVDDRFGLDELAWARWLDDTHGGYGFIDWQPIELEGEVSALIGGWEQETCFNPPVEVLPQIFSGVDEFVLSLAADLPRLDIEIIESQRDGRLALLRARVRNLGALPSGVGPGSDASGVRLSLELAEGVNLLSGKLQSSLGHLPGRGASPVLEWLFLAPQNTRVTLRVESEWTPSRSREETL